MGVHAATGPRSKAVDIVDRETSVGGIDCLREIDAFLAVDSGEVEGWECAGRIAYHSRNRVAVGVHDGNGAAVVSHFPNAFAVSNHRTALQRVAVGVVVAVGINVFRAAVGGAVLNGIVAGGQGRVEAADRINQSVGSVQLPFCVVPSRKRPRDSFAVTVIVAP